MQSGVFTTCSGSQLLGAERAEVFSLLLHLSDISHPGKPWTLHHEWSKRLAKEFFRQGDQEKQLGLPPSPLCDPDKTNLPTSQLGVCTIIMWRVHVVNCMCTVWHVHVVYCMCMWHVHVVACMVCYN